MAERHSTSAFPDGVRDAVIEHVVLNTGPLRTVSEQVDAVLSSKPIADLVDDLVYTRGLNAELTQRLDFYLGELGDAETRLRERHAQCQRAYSDVVRLTSTCHGLAKIVKDARRARSHFISGQDGNTPLNVFLDQLDRALGAATSSESQTASNLDVQIQARLLSGEHVGREVRVDSSRGVLVSTTMVDCPDDGFVPAHVRNLAPDDVVTLVAETGGAV